jgi:putative AdoMet-dependent methyltransferase
MTDRRTLFDGWAASYDADVRAAPEAYPFAGYDAVLDGLVALVRDAGAGRVLELGIGTGTLAARIAAAIPGVALWGVDFSAGMLSRARARVPGAHLLRADLDRDLPGLALPRVDAVVASYVLHELPDERKVVLIEHLFDRRLAPGGLLAIGDVAFADDAARAAVREATPSWDPTEHYLAADAFLAGLRERGIGGRFRPVSFCAGILTLRRNDRGRA